MGQTYEIDEVITGDPIEVADIITGDPIEVAEISTNTHVVPGKSPYIDPETNTWWQYDESLQRFVNTGQIVELPADGTPDQVLTKTADGAEWKDFKASVTDWQHLRGKPFESIDANVFEVNDGALKVRVTDDAVEGSVLPITSSGVHTIVGNIEVLLSLV